MPLLFSSMKRSPRHLKIIPAPYLAIRYFRLLYFMRPSLIILCSLMPLLLQAQVLAGIWRGKRTQVAGGCFPEYSTELHINYSKDNMVMGNAYNYYNKDQFTKINFTGRYNTTTQRLVLIEQAVVQYQVPDQCIPCIKTYDLNWTEQGKPTLDGDWKGHQMGNAFLCPPGKIHLEKENNAVFPVDVLQDDSLSQIQKGLRWEAREKEVVQTLALDTANIRIDLYDNAEIDGDTVSVFMNNTLLLYKKQLTELPLSLQVFAFPNMDYELLMYAENLGRIPPNTAIMVITAGKQRYEMRLASSAQKSAVVRFRFNQ